MALTLGWPTMLLILTQIWPFSIGKSTVTFPLAASFTVRVQFEHLSLSLSLYVCVCIYIYNIYVYIWPRNDLNLLLCWFHFSTFRLGADRDQQCPAMWLREDNSCLAHRFEWCFEMQQKRFVTDCLRVPRCLCKHSYAEWAPGSCACAGTGSPAPVMESEFDRTQRTLAQPIPKLPCSLRM